MAALLERKLGEPIERVHGSYGQFKIDVDGQEVVDAGLLAALGVVPSNATILEKVQAALAKTNA